MPTASTKSGRNQKKRPRSDQEKLPGLPSEEPPVMSSEFTDMDEKTWQAASLAVLIVSALLRFYHLDVNPLHHDEGVNGFFLLNLMRDGIYHYDPQNYHGPTLYYFTLPFAIPASKLGLLSGWVIRAVPGMFGVATVWLLLHLRKYIGPIGALSAAALMALSPGAVYMSRYFIHESLFVFFTVAIVIGVLLYFEDEIPGNSAKMTGAAAAIWAILLAGFTATAVYLPGYYIVELPLIAASLILTVVYMRRFDGFRSLYLLFVAAAAGLLFATKETAFITAGVLSIAAGLARIYLWQFGAGGPKVGPVETLRAKEKRGQPDSRRAPLRTQGQEAPKAFSETALTAQPTGGNGLKLVIVLVFALGIFVFINLTFYSSFFSYPEGVKGSLKAFGIWKDTGEKQHTHPLSTYIIWLAKEELPILILWIAGSALVLWKRRNRFAVFAALWASGIISAYSLIQYKTPWLSLNFILPMTIVGGYELQEIYDGAFFPASGARRTALALASIVLLASLVQSVSLNFVHYDDDSYPYVYAHTRREYLELINEIALLANRAGTGKDTTITVASPEYWPMPWYLRDYKHVGYPAMLGPTNDTLVITSETQAIQSSAVLGSNYRRVGLYPLRPGVNLVLFVRQDVSGASRMSAWPSRSPEI